MTELVRDTIDPFEDRLTRLVRAYSDPADVAIDAGTIARHAAAQRRATFGSLRWVVLAGLLVISLALALALGFGAFHGSALPMLVTAGDQIIAIDPESGGQRSLGVGASPVWSPDRTHIAFQLGLATWVMNSDGSGRRELVVSTTREYFTGPPVWTSDAEQILVAAGDLVLVEVADGLSHTLGVSTWKDGGTGAISADRRILALPQRDGLYLFDTAAAPVRPGQRVQSTSSLPWLPRWSPDGTQLAYAAADGVHIVDPDGQHDRPLHAGPIGTSIDALAWSPDGTRLAVADRSSTISVIDVTGNTTTQVFIGPAFATYNSVAWSRDGHQLAVAAAGSSIGDAGSVSIWLVNADGSLARRLAQGIDPIWDRGPDWW